MIFIIDMLCFSKKYYHALSISSDSQDQIVYIWFVSKNDDVVTNPQIIVIL